MQQPRLTQSRRDLVEHAIDVAETIGPAEGLRELDGFVDHDAVRNLEPALQFIGCDQENRVLDGRQCIDRAIQMRSEESAQILGVIVAPLSSSR